MTLVQVTGEVKKPTVKVCKRFVSKEKSSFEVVLHRYAAEHGLADVSSVVNAASGTQLSSHTVIKRCALFSTRAHVRIKLKNNFERVAFSGNRGRKQTQL